MLLWAYFFSSCFYLLVNRHLSCQYIWFLITLSSYDILSWLLIRSCYFGRLSWAVKQTNNDLIKPLLNGARQLGCLRVLFKNNNRGRRFISRHSTDTRTFHLQGASKLCWHFPTCLFKITCCEIWYFLWKYTVVENSEV